MPPLASRTRNSSRRSAERKSVLAVATGGGSGGGNWLSRDTAAGQAPSKQANAAKPATKRKRRSWRAIKRMPTMHGGPCYPHDPGAYAPTVNSGTVEAYDRGRRRAGIADGVDRPTRDLLVNGESLPALIVVVPSQQLNECAARHPLYVGKAGLSQRMGQPMPRFRPVAPSDGPRLVNGEPPRKSRY